MAGFDVYITPTLADALAVSQAGADVIALDATARPHPEGLTALISSAASESETGKPILADISTDDEALEAQDAGADFRFHDHVRIHAVQPAD